MKKYELLPETATDSPYGGTIYRIRALRDFRNVKAGDIGGYLESENNLSHDGDCWIADDAIVGGGALISEDAVVNGSAQVCGDARIFGNACISGWVYVAGSASIGGDSYIYCAEPDPGPPAPPRNNRVSQPRMN